MNADKNWTEAEADLAEVIDFRDFHAAEIRVHGKPAKTQNMAGETKVHRW